MTQTTAASFSTTYLQKGTRYWELIIDTMNNAYQTRYGKQGGQPSLTPWTPISPDKVEALKRKLVTEKTRAGYHGFAITSCPTLPQPMLALPLVEAVTYISFPCVVQPKIDGHRAVAAVNGAGQNYQRGICCINGRKGRRILTVPHIERALMEGLPEDVFTVLDGELYVPGLSFQELSGMINRKLPHPDAEKIQYHVFDLTNRVMKFGERAAALRYLVTESDHIKIVPNKVIYSYEEIFIEHDKFVSQGYEGIIIRNLDGYYKEGRSHDLIKYKRFDDAEFLCVGVQPGKRGKMLDKAVLVLVTNNGRTFNAKMVGSLEELKRYAEQPQLVVNKQITVQFQGLTKDGIPRFPVALRIREDI